jgi:hypothetical protein
MQYNLPALTDARRLSFHSPQMKMPVMPIRMMYVPIRNIGHRMAAPWGWYRSGAHAHQQILGFAPHRPPCKGKKCGGGYGYLG